MGTCSFFQPTYKGTLAEGENRGSWWAGGCNRSLLGLKVPVCQDPMSPLKNKNPYFC